LQAAATEDALMLSLGPQHSFPLADVFRYVHPATLRDTLIQAVLDAPVFATRWRWNATISLAVPRSRNGSKVPPPLQRMQADDLMAAAFPDAAACLDNIPGDREIPDHPLVNQSIRDCLDEAMDMRGLSAVLEAVHADRLTLVSRDTPEPSPFADEVLNARPYAFLDDAPLEERRAHAVQARRPADAGAAHGSLDPSAITRVVDEAHPDPRDPEELHDVLLTAGFLQERETDAALLRQLASQARATRAHTGNMPPAGSGEPIWVAAERLPEIQAVHPGVSLEPAITAPPSRLGRNWTREEALASLFQGRMTFIGPVTVAALAGSLSVRDSDADAALLDLEAQGLVLRGVFTPGNHALEWCDRVLLARIHRYTLNRLRAEISPVSAAEFMRVLFAWQHVDSSNTLAGPDGLRAVMAQLDGVELPARAWERDVLPARIAGYTPALLDTLCLTGEVAWARLSTGPTQVVGATPIALFLRQHAEAWLSLRSRDPEVAVVSPVLDRLRSHGASFSHDLASACSMSAAEVRSALADLVAGGSVSCDGPAGLRRIIGATPAPGGGHAEGRWFALTPPIATGNAEGTTMPRAVAVEAFAWTLLRRYGVVFRRLLAREAATVPWRELTSIYRRLEARGEIRGGRFVSGTSGEQYALPEAVERLREVRRTGPDGRLINISAADPLNLTGIVTPGDRIRVASGSRVVYRNGVPVAAMEGDMLRVLAELEPSVAAEAAAAAAGRRVPVLSGYVGRLG
jgi:ATP-dependent Lhr-like helicase